MSFKLHLVIVSTIIVLVILASQLIIQAPKETPAPAPVASPYSIAIVRASWGLECNDPVNPSSANVPENNVKDKIAAICEGKTECIIPIDVKVLGNDPAPKCPNKQLFVEYRCFTFDRLQNIKAVNGNATIKCDQPIPEQLQK